MERIEFIKSLTSLTLMALINPLSSPAKGLHETQNKMPALFIGHGSPMNGIELNPFSQQWINLGKEYPAPTAVICISAHWLTNGTKVTAMELPKTIHDFGGFPDALSKVQYPAPGSLSIAKTTKQSIESTDVMLDYDWGLDHGSWTVLRHMYPQATIPIIQLSIDFRQPANYHYQLAKELRTLRDKGVLIIGSGNMVHNLGKIAWDKMDEPNYGYDWAIEMNETFKKHILSRNHTALIDYQKLGNAAQLAVPTPDHYYPLLYILALEDKNDNITFFNDACVAGSLSMTSVKIAQD